MNSLVRKRRIFTNKSIDALADGTTKKEFPRFRSLLEPQFPLGNPLFRAAVRATR
jgi:hypothetical protein